jgi:methylmalonyl-CoA mutase N-terminal domain/subunit
VPLDAVYEPPAADRVDPLPGVFPFTRGPYASMYRGRLWTMRQFAGYGTPAETNARFRLLLERGQTGLSVAFDMPTLMGLDPDDPRSIGEVGRCGVAVATLDDVESLFAGIPLDEVTVSMTINGPAPWIFACYLAAAERQGVAWRELGGTLQTDIFKEYTAQKEWLFPPRPHLRLIGDLMAFCASATPRYHPISVSGYHIREAGSTAVQELAFTLADGLAYVESGVARGLDVDAFAPRLSFFFNSHIDFFEEIAKLRAARRMWCRFMRDRFGAKNPRSWMLRTHVQTAGCSLTAQQPVNNVVRVTVQALAAVLGGTQSLHTNSLDETLALPSEESVRIALRTQQILAEETGITHTVDPLAGSYFVETLTSRMEAAALDLIRRIDEMGGMIPAIEQGFPQREIAEASYRYQSQVDSGEKTLVGVNRYTEGNGPPPELLQIDREVERDQRARLAAVKTRRDARSSAAVLERLQQAAAGSANLMPHVLDAVRAYASVQEICDALKPVFGLYREGKVAL